jgi:hypothetical protein
MYDSFFAASGRAGARNWRTFRSKNEDLCWGAFVCRQHRNGVDMQNYNPRTRNINKIARYIAPTLTSGVIVQRFHNIGTIANIRIEIK